MPDYDYGGVGIDYSNLNASTNASSIGDAIGRWWNDATGKSALNVFNSSEAQKNRDWQTMMSNTAYQRAAADMKAAGINPASLGGNAAGSAASTPSGSAASSVSGSSGGGLIGMVLQGIGMGLKGSIMRSALSTKDGYLDLARFKANSQAALNAAKVAETDATSALKQQEAAHKAKMYKAKREEAWWKSKDDWDDPFAGMSAEEKERMIAIANTPWLDS